MDLKRKAQDGSSQTEDVVPTVARMKTDVLMNVVLMPVAVAEMPAVTEWADIPARDIPGTKTWRCRSGK